MFYDAVQFIELTNNYLTVTCLTETTLKRRYLVFFDVSPNVNLVVGEGLQKDETAPFKPKHLLWALFFTKITARSIMALPPGSVIEKLRKWIWIVTKVTAYLPAVCIPRFLFLHLFDIVTFYM